MLVEIDAAIDFPLPGAPPESRIPCPRAREPESPTQRTAQRSWWRQRWTRIEANWRTGDLPPMLRTQDSRRVSDAAQLRTDIYSRLDLRPEDGQGSKGKAPDAVASAASVVGDERAPSARTRGEFRVSHDVLSVESEA